ncbi:MULTISPECIES: CocE/NonD family hydrolase [Gordonia]|jgi:putative CocE/NonD family hydrolase|uniref:CocE/NonD family hydrolase n=1 Tax=Gordonia TaxID=2053 RepID=UPI003015D219
MIAPHVEEITVSDRTVLRSRVWEPPNSTAVALIRTPYAAKRHDAIGRAWAARGYTCLIQDVRGRYSSDGTWEPYRNESADGGDTVDEVARRRPQLPIVLYGASYAAHTALEAARAAHAQVAAVIVAVPVLGPAETTVDGAGTLQIRHRVGWWHRHGVARTTHDGLSDRDLTLRTREVTELGVDAAARAWGWPAHTSRAWRRIWSAPRVDPAVRYRHVHAPLLTISGDNDFFDHDAKRLAQTWPSGPSHLASGPWGHGLTADSAPGLHEQVRSAGGLAAVIDPWLNVHGLPGRPAQWTSPLSPLHRTSSIFDPAVRTWIHERITS